MQDTNLCKTAVDEASRPCASRVDFLRRAAPGHWNDPEMLQVGNRGMTAEEYRSHFSMWAMMTAPLMTGNDLRGMSAEAKSIPLHGEVIAFGERPGAQCPRPGLRGPGLGPLADGSRAGAVLNLSEKEADLYVRWSDIGAGPASGSGERPRSLDVPRSARAHRQRERLR